MPDVDGLKGLAPAKNLPAAGVVANAPWQTVASGGTEGFLKAEDFELAVAEFDDQGRCYERSQLDAISKRIEGMRVCGPDAVLLVFVHGWKHNAGTRDENLTSFREVLRETARHERRCVGEVSARPVMGVFVGWRGLTAPGPTDLVADATFWGRQDAAQRVATGSVRELFGRLRHYRNGRRKRGGSPLLVIAGHSFGGMIVFSALSQSLVEAASTPVGQVVPGFADLVLLVNPAVEGARYLPIHDLAGAAARAGGAAQLPVFVCVQAMNDQPVGTWFPVGNANVNRRGILTPDRRPTLTPQNGCAGQA